MTNIESLEKDLKMERLESLYLIYGEDSFLIENCVKKIKKIFGEKIYGINFIKIEDGNQEEIINEIQTPPFGYDKKLIFIKNSGLFKREIKKKTNANLVLQEKLTKYLTDHFKEIEPYVILLFQESDAEKNDLYQIIEKNGIVCEVKELKPQQVILRIKAIISAYKVKIDDGTLRYLIESCGTNLQELINEIRKLIEYVGEAGTIIKEHVDKLCIKKIDSVIFDLTDHLGKLEIQQALKVLQELLDQKEPLPKILITLYNHFKKLYLTTLAIEDKRDIGEVLNLKPNQMFLVTKYKMQANYFRKQQLNTILKELIELDSNYKSGHIDLQIGLEAILSCYCSSN